MIKKGAPGSTGTNANAGTFATIFYDAMNYTSGGGITVNNNTSYYNAFQIVQAAASAAPIAAFNQTFTMQPGTYNLYAHGAKTLTSGQFGFSIDGGGVTVLDMYGGGVLGVFLVASFTITGNNHILNVLCTGKNASSSAYNGYFYKFSVY